MRFSVISSPVVAAVIGFGGTLALLLAAANAVGASEVETASWVTAICLAIAAGTAVLSVVYRQPIVTAWSAAGLALIGASSGFTMAEAVGAFAIASGMLFLTGILRPLMRLIERIPAAVSAGMLGGIMLPFVMSGAKAAETDPAFIMPLVALFLIIRLKNPPMAVLGVLVAGGAAAFFFGSASGTPTLVPSSLVFIAPDFTIAATVGLAIPIYLVTMASQYLPGFAVLRADGYEPSTGPIIAVTGAFSTLSAFFGASVSNLAAITAAISTGEEAHPDANKRWMVGISYSLSYLIFAIFGASLVALFALLPPTLITLAMGLALLPPLTNATEIALSHKGQRVAAMATFAVTASGISFFGIGAAFWGLTVGLLMVGLQSTFERVSQHR
jgi:benzoate membrane transport protein